MLCSLLSSLLNVSIDVNCPSWIQASLPIRLGGLGFRSAEQLAPSCYLSSAAASQCLLNLILSTTSLSQVSPRSDEALSVWSSKFPSLSLPAADKVPSRRNGTTLGYWLLWIISSILPQMKFVLPDSLLFQLLKLAPGYSLCLSLLLASDSTILLLESVLPSV